MPFWTGTSLGSRRRLVCRGGFHESRRGSRACRSWRGTHVALGLQEDALGLLLLGQTAPAVGLGLLEELLVVVIRQQGQSCRRERIRR